MSGLKELPIAGKGIIKDNGGGFYLVKVTKLFLKDGSVIHVSDYGILINTAKKFSGIPPAKKKLIIEPKSFGAGPHISLDANQVCKDFENVEINFKIDGNSVIEYIDNNVHYITLMCKEPFSNSLSVQGLRGRDPKFPHITIGRVLL